MLILEPSRRLSMEQICKNKWMRQGDPDAEFDRVSHTHKLKNTQCTHMMFAVQLFSGLKQYFTCKNVICLFLCQLIAECEQVKVERETEIINEQILMAMSEMGFDRERTYR